MLSGYQACFMFGGQYPVKDHLLQRIHIALLALVQNMRSSGDIAVGKLISCTSALVMYTSHVHLWF